MHRPQLKVGIIGAGIGGLTAAIAIARAGADVTILEQAPALGEIGAGIQMFPNVSRFLVRWGVDKIIGDNLVLLDEANTYSGREAKLVARTDPKVFAKNCGFPWYVVRRDHLHGGLCESARQHGAKLHISSRVRELEELEDGRVKVTTNGGTVYEFDLVIGADGVNSTVRQHLFPGLMPAAPRKIAACRAVLPYDTIFSAVPEAQYYLRNAIDIWTNSSGYIITYPISGGKECNFVTAICDDDYVVKPRGFDDIDEFRDYYKDFPPVLQQIIKLVPATQRWPLLQMPKLDTWSNKQKNVVLLGDAAHCMQNHMAQGAATAMEDGAFLGRAISEVVRGSITIPEAVEIYEKRRIPKAWVKQQISFTSGLVNATHGMDNLKLRDRASDPEVRAVRRNLVKPGEMPSTYRSWQFYCNDSAAPGVFYYDAEGDADNAVCEFLQDKGDVDEVEMISASLKKMWLGYIDNNGVDDFTQNGVKGANGVHGVNGINGANGEKGVDGVNGVVADVVENTVIHHTMPEQVKL